MEAELISKMTFISSLRNYPHIAMKYYIILLEPEKRKERDGISFEINSLSFASLHYSLLESTSFSLNSKGYYRVPSYSTTYHISDCNMVNCTHVFCLTL